MGLPINELEQYLDLPIGFFHELQSEDDWSFIVKIYSLLEATSNALLTEEFGRSEVLDAFANVPMGSRKAGKLAFAESLKLLSMIEIEFLEQMGWIRNKFVHNVGNTQKSLSQFIQEQTPEKRKELIKAVAGTLSRVYVNGHELSGIEYAEHNPAQAIWVTATRVLEMMRLRIIMGKNRQQFVVEKIREHLATNEPIVIRDGAVELV